MNKNTQIILDTWGNLEYSWAFKASTDDFIFIALKALSVTESRAAEIIDSIGEAYYEASCNGATEEALAAMILEAAI